ncbi:tripartite tricarboxylate transporter TctB family protein [Chelativorans sp. AA-79]|uniref:tripartite tricarboxylate transporter TctB family protein n=1 Tax=Chelativorans sp. AA-79 TaxID=3028735 RepID=UPI0023F89C7F|nr:tripartite tricarboxylate transporter TctB family protein [Chelativorans sp. AA-79]WEX10920.1 tripartite tricarboxylate transporter TctB family protein [Chelativorans sp. AA-79]
MTVSSNTLAGAIFLFFGMATVIVGWGYGLGTMTQLGSGALPVVAGGALSALGVVQLLSAVRSAASAAVPAFSRFELRPLLSILGAVLAFAVLILPTGLVPALVALVAIGWFAQKGGAKWEIAGAMIVVIVLVTAIFKYGLGLPLRLFVWGF